MANQLEGVVVWTVVRGVPWMRRRGMGKNVGIDALVQDFVDAARIVMIAIESSLVCVPDDLNATVYAIVRLASVVV